MPCSPRSVTSVSPSSGSVILPCGTDSPVRADSFRRRLPLSTRRRSAGTTSPESRQYDVARHQFGGVDFLLLAITQDAGRNALHLAQRLHRARRAEFGEEADGGVDGDGDEDRKTLDHFPEQE